MGNHQSVGEVRTEEEKLEICIKKLKWELTKMLSIKILSRLIKNPTKAANREKEELLRNIEKFEEVIDYLEG